MATQTKRKIKRTPAAAQAHANGAASSNGNGKAHSNGKPASAPKSAPTDPLDLFESLHTRLETVCSERDLEDQQERIADLEAQLEYERGRQEEMSRTLRAVYRQLEGKLTEKPPEPWREPLRKFLTSKPDPWSKVPAWSTLQKDGATDAELEKQIRARSRDKTNSRWSIQSYRFAMSYLGEAPPRNGQGHKARGQYMVLEGKAAFLAAVRAVMGVPVKKQVKKAAKKKPVTNKLAASRPPAETKPAVKIQPNKSRRKKPATQAEVTKEVLSGSG